MQMLGLDKVPNRLETCLIAFSCVSQRQTAGSKLFCWCCFQKLLQVEVLALIVLAGSTGLDEEVRVTGAQGFIGCLSSVQFNHIAPLKAALHHHRSAVVTVKGRLVESSCGSTSMADLKTFTTTHSLSGIIAVVIFITVCVTAIMTRFLYQHRKSHQTGTEKAKEHRENLEYSLRNHTDLHHSVSESKKEYFI
ncbi:UNVERIFIED_CONTAM: hypothetical protein FKN15_065750 [Acipenser sinensis]